MNHEELINKMARIIERRKDTLNHFIENADKSKQQDKGVEGWFQLELIAELWNPNDKPIEHPKDGPDLMLPDGEEIELKMTTSFRPDWTIDGLVEHKKMAPVLFFSGYLNHWKKKENPDFEKQDEVKQWFQDLFHKKKMDEKFGLTGFSIIYKTVDLVKEKGIVGIIEPSKEINCEKI